MSGLELLLVGLAAAAAGAVNALAGGGTLLTFPALTAAGLPAIVANVTSTVALCPGYLGATLAQSSDLRGQKRRLLLLLPAGVLGGVLGAALLVSTGEQLFRTVVPYLILVASGLLAAQPPLRAWLERRAARRGSSIPSEKWAVGPVALAAIYGGYFGAGLSVILLAALALALDDSLTRLNALKQAISFSANAAAALFLVFSGKIAWPAAIVMMAAALIGGACGGRLASRVRSSTLRAVVVVIGVVVAGLYLLP